MGDDLIGDAASVAPNSPASNRVSSIAFSPNGRYITAGHEDATVRFWDLQRGKRLWASKSGSKAIAFSHNGKRLFVAAWMKMSRHLTHLMVAWSV
jgi:WD40 repeat protein